ncbi:MAG: hypothetical protein WCI20_00375 [bacterium]
MKRKTNKSAGRQNSNSQTRPNITWDQFNAILSRQGVADSTVEIGTTRLALPISYSDPEDGFDALLRDAWFLTYGGKRRLVAAPFALKAEYLTRKESELCGEEGISKGAFKLLYAQEAQMLRLDCRRRWTIPSRLFAFLEMGDNRSVVLRPGDAWINIVPKDVDDQEQDKALKELTIPAFPGGAQN